MSEPTRAWGAILTESLARGLHLLSVVAEVGAPVGLSELAQRAGLDKATTYRLARTLLAAGHLSQDPSSRRYRLGVRVLDLGTAYLRGIDLRGLALPYMRALTREFGESTSLSILDGRDIVYLERLRASQFRVSIDVQIGSRVPTYCSSMGKVLLAWLTEEQRRQIVGPGPFPTLTPRTITDPARLEQELAVVRRRKFAVNDEEMALGLRSVAAAIHDHTGRPVAALNVAVPTAQVSRADLETRIAPRVVQAAAAISAQLGFVDPVSAALAGRRA